MDAIAIFANEAVMFERWLLSGTDQHADAARECLIRLVGLYRAGIGLPSACPNETPEQGDIEGVGDEGWRAAYEASARLPIDYYAEVFDPTEIERTAPGIASLADDLADIYRDIVPGLRSYQRGDHASALWEWTFGLHAHWGAHATVAIRALHWWLRNNNACRLSDDRVDKTRDP
jgi:hypothetical protein